MNILRTPEERFNNLKDYPFESHYVDVNGLRVHYVDEGSSQGEIILMLHGEPSWSYLYRKMIPIFVDSGFRSIAPDLVGFGKSDKPADQGDYTYQRHVDWTWRWFESLNLNDVNIICHDWGSLIGLRLVAEYPERFQRVVLTNGGLPTGDHEMPEAFYTWQDFSRRVSRLPISRIIQGGTQSNLSSEELSAYEAPFPDETYKAGARIFPSLVPTKPDDPAGPVNRKAWRALHRFDKPFLTAFGDSDPITQGGDRIFQRLVRGAKGQPHTSIEGAGHFIQEDKGPELAQVVLDFIEQS